MFFTGKIGILDNLYYLASNLELPWVVSGDFNMVFSEEEKIRGLPVYPTEYEDFTFCVNSCGFFLYWIQRSPSTWSNGRPNSECIFKRLDRILSIYLSRIFFLI